MTPLQPAGTLNFRDLGGLTAVDGRRVRPGRLFRSDTLQALSAADVQLLVDGLGLRTVIDLRLEVEVEQEGRGLLARRAEVAFINSPLGMATRDGIPPDRVLIELYESCLASPSLLTTIRAIATNIDAPTLFHCAAGKDRTGVVAAIVLGILGVDSEQIVADYMRSATAMPRMIERFMTWPRYRDHLAAMPPAVYDVEEAPIRHVLATLEREHAGARNWALHRGIPSACLARLDEALLESG